MSTEADIVETAAKAMRACVLHEAFTQELRDLDWERIGDAREIYRREARAAIAATSPAIRAAAARDMRERCAKVADLHNSISARNAMRPNISEHDEELWDSAASEAHDIAVAIRATPLLATDQKGGAT